MAFIGTCGSWIALSYWGRRPVFISGLAILATCLILVGGISFAGDSNARWGSAALVLVWVFVYDFTVGVSRAESTVICPAHLAAAGICHCRRVLFDSIAVENGRPGPEQLQCGSNRCRPPLHLSSQPHGVGLGRKSWVLLGELRITGESRMLTTPGRISDSHLHLGVLPTARIQRPVVPGARYSVRSTSSSIKVQDDCDRRG